MIEFGEISMAGSATVSLLVSCNAPFRFAFISLNGGLAQTAGVKVKPPFLSLLPYSLTYRLPTSAGFLIDTCSSSNMSATGGACAGRSWMARYRLAKLQPSDFLGIPTAWFRQRALIAIFFFSRSAQAFDPGKLNNAGRKLTLIKLRNILNESYKVSEVWLCVQ